MFVKVAFPDRSLKADRVLLLSVCGECPSNTVYLELLVAREDRFQVALDLHALDFVNREIAEFELHLPCFLELMSCTAVAGVRSRTYLPIEASLHLRRLYGVGVLHRPSTHRTETSVDLCPIRFVARASACMLDLRHALFTGVVGSHRASIRLGLLDGCLHHIVWWGRSRVEFHPVDFVARVCGGVRLVGWTNPPRHLSFSSRLLVAAVSQDIHPS